MTEHHPLVKALIAEVPTCGVWPESLRDRWMTAAAAVFDLVYGKGDTIDMREVLVPKDDSAALVIEESHIDPAVLNIVRNETVLVPNVGGRPKTTGPVRPGGIPTNLAMALEAIEDNYGKAAATQILKFVRVKYWAEAPDAWTASLYDQVKAKKLARDGINFIRPVAPKIEEKPLAPIAVARAEPPARPVSAPANRAPENGVEFSYGGKMVLLHKTEFRVAEAMRRAMGKGHLDYAYLAQAGLASGRRPSSNDKGWCAEIMSILQPKLETIGLRVTHAPAFGYVMERVDG